MIARLHIDGDRRRSYVASAGLVLSAWLALAVWSRSPYAVWLDHAEIENIAAPATVRLGIFTLGWTLMIVAMMLPGTLVLLARCLDNRPLRAREVAPEILAYLAVWTVFGAFSYWADSVLHEIVEQAPALAGVIAPGVLLLAGVYQLTPMKRICLSRCRPEGAAFAQSSRQWSLGLRHGVFCLGSCWALMLLMFASGGVHLLWMLTLSTVMTAERITDRADLLRRVLGLTLIVCSFLPLLR